jgi:putative transposase
MLPRRKFLDHVPPRGILPGALFFVTINCKERGTNQLCRQPVADVLFESARHREALGQWALSVMLLMPDHVHMVVAFEEDQDMMRTIRLWKAYTARRTGVRWQRDFFEHRIRRHESADEKVTYIRNNPVRERLVERPEDWPFVLLGDDVG